MTRGLKTTGLPVPVRNTSYVDAGQVVTINKARHWARSANGRGRVVGDEAEGCKAEVRHSAIEFGKVICGVVLLVRQQGEAGH
jgi:hypothetical protein